jgi:EpsI family protein
MRRSNFRFWAMFVLLLAGGTVVNLWERAGEAHVERRTLAEFPTQLGAWRQRGTDEKFSDEVEQILRADDYLLRDYIAADGRTASFYVGYYFTQRNGATYHSPLNCLPGSGWTMRDPATIRITPAGGGASFEANRYVVENGDSRQLLIYWYQGRGRAVASEYWGKLYTVVDSVKMRRSDGAMVRVMVPFGTDEAAALRSAQDLASLAAQQLPAFVPN